MALPTNSFRTNRYFRSKFNEGKYLLAAEATDLQLETQDFIKEFLKNSYGNIAVGNAWKVDSISSTQLRIRPGVAFDGGIPFVLKSGSDGIVVQGISPSAGYTFSDQNAGTSDAGGKKIVISALLTNGNYTVVIEAREELVKPSGSGAVDAFLQGVNVNEETGNKLRLIYKIHTILTSDLTETPTFPQSGTVHNFSNRIVVTPQTGVANFVISSIPITQDVNGADLRLTLDNANANLPFSTDAQEYINGLFIDSDGNEMTITSITTEDGGATVKLLLDRQVEFNSSTPKSGTPVITNLVPYQLIKRDYYVSSNGGVPLGQHYMKIASFTATGGAISALTDLRTTSDINTFGVDANARLSGGGAISFDDSTDTVTFAAALKVTFPSSAAVVTIASGSAVLPSDLSVAYFDIDRTATAPYTRTLTIASKSALSKSANHYIVMERRDNRIFFPHNGSVGDAETGFLGSFGTTPGFVGHNHDGSDGESSALAPASITMSTETASTFATFNASKLIKSSLALANLRLPRPSFRSVAADSSQVVIPASSTSPATVLIGGTFYTNVTNLAVDLDTAGANGLDTGSKADDTIYYLYAILPSSGTTFRATISASGPTTGPTGFSTNWSYLGSFRTVSSAAVPAFTSVNGIFNTVHLSVDLPGIGNSNSNAARTALCSVNATSITYRIIWATVNAVADTVELGAYSGIQHIVSVANSATAGNCNVVHVTIPLVTPNTFYTSNTSTSDRFDLSCTAWSEDPLKFQ